MDDAGAGMADPDVGVGDAEDRFEHFLQGLVEAGVAAAYASEACGNLARHVLPVIHDWRFDVEEGARNDIVEHILEAVLFDWDCRCET